MKVIQSDTKGVNVVSVVLSLFVAVVALWVAIDSENQPGIVLSPIVGVAVGLVFRAAAWVTHKLRR